MPKLMRRDAHANLLPQQSANLLAEIRLVLAAGPPSWEELTMEEC
jgi:hypothetical protein